MRLKTWANIVSSSLVLFGLQWPVSKYRVGNYIISTDINRWLVLRWEEINWFSSQITRSSTGICLGLTEFSKKARKYNSLLSFCVWFLPAQWSVWGHLCLAGIEQSFWQNVQSRFHNFVHTLWVSILIV